MGIAIAGGCSEAQCFVQRSRCCPDSAGGVVLESNLAIPRPALDRCQTRALAWLAEFLQVAKLENFTNHLGAMYRWDEVRSHGG